MKTNKLYRFILKQSYIKIYGITLVISWVIPRLLTLCMFAPFYDDSSKQELEITERHSIWESITFIPLFETIIFQTLLILIFNKLLKFNIFWTTIICGIIFGLNHPFDLFYIICTSFIGIIFAGGYIYFQRKYDHIVAIACITSIHAIQNAISILLNSVYF